MTFTDAFSQTDVALCIQPGIQALGGYSGLIHADDPREFEASVDLDSCLRARFPQDNRWDYAFGYKARQYYVEVHHVSDGEVDVVIRKYRWLRDWQNSQPHPMQLKTNSEYYWVSSGSGSLSKNSKYAHRLIQAGLSIPRKSLHLS